MPRKPALKKHTVTVVVDGMPVTAILHPPSGGRKSWYAYWNGLISSRSTGRARLEEAVTVAESMLRRSLGGAGVSRPTPADLTMSDEEFEEIQREHYGKRQGAEAQA